MVCIKWPQIRLTTIVYAKFWRENSELLGSFSHHHKIIRIEFVWGVTKLRIADRETSGTYIFFRKTEEQVIF